MENRKKAKLSLGVQIFIALVLGIVVGILLTGQVLGIVVGILLTGQSAFAAKYIKPFGTIFLNLVKWVVTPLVFFSIMAGVISMRTSTRSAPSA